MKPGGRAALTTRAAILGLVLCALVLALAYPLQQYLSQRSQIARTVAATAADRARVAQLQRQQARWARPSYVEQQAREQLHETLPGQQLYTVLGAPTPHRPVHRQGNATVSTDPNAPWYSRLWASDVAAGA